MYERHQPECTLLYKLIEQHYPDFVAHLAEQDRILPKYVQSEFEAYLKCGILAHGFVRVRCECCHHERHVAFSCKRCGFCPSCCARRLTHKISVRLATYLERAGLVEGYTENQYLAEDVLRDNEMSEHQGFSVHYRISVGPQKGRKVFTLQS